MPQAEIEAEIASLRKRILQLEQQRKRWPQLGKSSRGLAIKFAIAGICLVVISQILHQPNPAAFAIAMSFGLVGLPLYLLSQALGDA